MGTLSPQQFSDAAKKWSESRHDLTIIENLFRQNSVFNLHKSQIDTIKSHNDNDDFCAQIGVTENNELIMIPLPLDGKGYPVRLDEYSFALFETLKEDLYLTEKQTYTVVNKSVLSTSMRKKDSDSDVFLPVINKPVLEQEKALEAIELWQNNAFDWFYAEFKQNEGSSIFNKFYVPTEKIFKVEEGIMFVSVFGLKFSEIYRKQLPALIFISAPDNLSNQSVEIDSNTLDYAKPCPPSCNIFDLG